MTTSNVEPVVFKQRVRMSVQHHLNDENFTVYDLANEIGLSYSQLARRLKEEAGLNPTRLIRNVRAEQAAQYIKEGATNMTDIAYSVGFNSLAHFSRCFREHLGISPTQYLKTRSKYYETTP